MAAVPVSEIVVASCHEVEAVVVIAVSLLAARASVHPLPCSQAAAANLMATQAAAVRLVAYACIVVLAAAAPTAW